MSVTTEAQRILGAQQDGNDEIPDEFWELVERYRGDLINQALSIVGDASDAEDVVQETFCRAYRHRERLAEVRSLGAWLRTLNKAHALNRRRHDQTDQRHSKQKGRESQRSMTTGGFSLIDLREEVTRSVEKLSPKHRTVVLLRFLEGLSYEEIAERLDLAEGTVGWLLCEAQVKLHKLLRPRFENRNDATT